MLLRKCTLKSGQILSDVEQHMVLVRLGTGKFQNLEFLYSMLMLVTAAQLEGTGK